MKSWKRHVLMTLAVLLLIGAVGTLADLAVTMGRSHSTATSQCSPKPSGPGWVFSHVEHGCKFYDNLIDYARSAERNARADEQAATHRGDDALAMAAAAQYWYCYDVGEVHPHHLGYARPDDHLCSAEELDGFSP